MKRRNKKILPLITTVLLLCGGVVTAKENYELKGFVNVNTRLNVREQPTTESQVIQKLKAGDIVTIIPYEENEEEIDDWKKIITETGKVGYVYEDYLIISEVDVIDESKCELISTAVITAESSSENRNFNMAKACEAINGLVLEPGEEFNWYGKNGVGPATKENGYKLSTVISGKKYIKGYGGGVCQVSTALYNCINKLGIVPTEHHYHSLKSSYVVEGMDATVAYPSKNFIFTNTKDYSILFEAYTDASKVIISAYKVIE